MTSARSKAVRHRPDLHRSVLLERVAVVERRPGRQSSAASSTSPSAATTSTRTVSSCPVCRMAAPVASTSAMRDDAMRELSAAERLLAGARQLRHPARRRAVSEQHMRDKPFFVVNGGRDPLYPTSRVRSDDCAFQAGAASRSTIGRSRTRRTTRGGGRRCGTASRRSCASIRANRCPTR